MRILSLIFIAIIFSFSSASAQDSKQYCNITDEFREQILQQVKNKNPDAIRSLPECFKLDRSLILKAAIIDPAQFQNAAEILKSDENFVRRLIKADAETLQYASLKLRFDKTFMESATYLNRDALQYADKRLLDNKLFMKKMIKNDSRNYLFASDRLKEIPEFIEMAFSDNGELLCAAPSKIKADKKLVKIAFKSDNEAIKCAADELKKDKEFEINKKPISPKERQSLEEFLQKNYVVKSNKKNLNSVISNQEKFFPKDRIIKANYVTKWQRRFISQSIEESEKNLRLITVDSRNYPISWKEDFSDYPDLIKKIENFFLNRHVDQSTIDSLLTTYLWEIKSQPLTLAFNLYLLRDSSDEDFGAEFSDITSLTVIAQRQKNLGQKNAGQKVKGQKDKWNFSVIEVIFASETKVGIEYLDGHKKYILWDLYKENKNDKNPKIIFKVEDRFREYFEIFDEESGGKYKMIHSFEPAL